jgi:hypothetical protein
MFAGLSGSEGNNAAHRIVRRHSDGYTVAWNHFDAETAHAAAQLGEHFVTGVALDAIQTSAVHCYHRSLHVD